MTKSTLSALSQVRPWKGIPSTTQLINPTLMEYLKIVREYYIDPQERAFAFIGTRAHKKLEGADTNISILENFFASEEGEGITATPDCYELEEGKGILTDYKCWGAWTVARALGIVREKWDVETGEYYKNGKPKTKVITNFKIDPGKADNFEPEMQLNRYRMLFEKAGFPVDVMQAQVFVRDGGILAAKRYGVEQKIVLIPIRRLCNTVVSVYFELKKQALLTALATAIFPAPCSYKESWEGRRCKGYCDVAEFCPYMVIGEESMD